MAKNFIQAGNVLSVVAPADVVSGALVKVGVLCGVAQTDALTGELVEIDLEGVYDLAKTSAQAWTQGQAIFMVPGTLLCTTAATAGNLFIGAAAEAAVNPSATGKVRLNGSAPTAVA
jgi:predicted RecA/RadA family phage recombinase